MLSTPTSDTHVPYLLSMSRIACDNDFDASMVVGCLVMTALARTVDGSRPSMRTCRTTSLRKQTAPCEQGLHNTRTGSHIVLAREHSCQAVVIFEHKHTADTTFHLYDNSEHMQ